MSPGGERIKEGKKTKAHTLKPDTVFRYGSDHQKALLACF